MTSPPGSASAPGCTRSLPAAVTSGREVSKSSASVAARLLEMMTLVTRHGVRGSRRVLYAASDNYAGMVTAQNRTLQALADLLRAGARTAHADATRARLEDMADFYRISIEALEEALRRWRTERSAP